ncbi:oligoribonuclease [Candidatus Saccharibacteria bacterium]|nr:oligoribonuclease [Candidatus Saccharibacteria bacterium]
MSKLDRLKNTIPTKLLWVDLEMTGLNPNADRIVEVAIEITDFNFDVIDNYEAVIHQPEDVIQSMNPWAASQHSASGLTAKIKNSNNSEDQVVNEVTKLIKLHFKDEPAILAGNSIWNDRNFIRKWWPEVDSLLHYRMLDVSSLKILMQGIHHYDYQKKSSHRALDDIQESRAELKDYLNKLKNGS